MSRICAAASAAAGFGVVGAGFAVGDVDAAGGVTGAAGAGVVAGAGIVAAAGLSSAQAGAPIRPNRSAKETAVSFLPPCCLRCRYIMRRSPIFTALFANPLASSKAGDQLLGQILGACAGFR
jgi:hypothetical protein